MTWSGRRDEDCEKDFEKEGIDLVVDGDFVRAEGTTLGGDDGIAVAMMLAILDDETLVHPGWNACSRRRRRPAFTGRRPWTVPA